MPGKIQTPAFGFLSALGLKSSGQQPFESEPNLTNVYNMNEFYDSGLITTFSQSQAGVQVVGDSVTATVPAGKAWRLIALQTSMSALAVNDDIRIGFAIRWRGNTIRIGSTPWFQNVAAGDLPSWGFIVPQPVVLLAGTGILALIEQATLTAAETINVGGIVVEYDV